jgi:solute carrier family 20 (sodium-dependent phosphate transporter)
VQVLTSCADSFAHGANDVANAVGPFSAIYYIYKHGTLAKKTNTDAWILVLGGLGIVLGLSTYGYTIISAIGVKMTKITPSRGFAIELGSAIIVVTGSYLGLPLSTTHCQVGATVAVGMVEGRKGVEWMIVLKSVLAWIMTLIIVGLTSAILMAQGIFAPNLRSLETITGIRSGINDTSRAITKHVSGLCPDNAAFQVCRPLRGCRQHVCTPLLAHLSCLLV